MNASSVASYSIALYDLIDKSKENDYVAAMKEILFQFNNENNFSRLLNGYNLTTLEKNKIIDETFKKINLPYLDNLIKLLAGKHKIDQFNEVLQSFCSLVNDHQGVKEGLLYSAFKLNESQIEAIRKELEKTLNCKVSLQVKIDEALLGGVKVAIDGKVFDGSLRSKLLGLKKELKGGIDYEN